MKKWNYLLPILILCICLSVPLASAQAALLPPCNPAPGNVSSCNVDYFLKLAVNVYNYLLALMAIIAVLILVYSGIRMLLYQFDEKPEDELKAARISIRRALFGMIIIICAYMIVYTILVALGVQEGPGGEGSLREFLGRLGFTL